MKRFETFSILQAEFQGQVSVYNIVMERLTLDLRISIQTNKQTPRPSTNVMVFVVIWFWIMMSCAWKLQFSRYIDMSGDKKRLHACSYSAYRWSDYMMESNGELHWIKEHRFHVVSSLIWTYKSACLMQISSPDLHYVYGEANSVIGNNGRRLIELAVLCAKLQHILS